MEKTPKNHIFHSMLNLLVLFPSLCLGWFLGFGLTPLLITFLILILSTIFLLSLTKKIITLDENPTGILLEKELKTQVVEFEKLKRYDYEPSLESISENGQIQYEESEGSVDSEISQSFELNWMCSSSPNLEQDFSISDSSFSDEEEDYDNLIEISLPGRDSSGLLEEDEEEHESKQKLQPNFSEAIFNQQGLMELLADINEMNEEENLIEIDISMGSIKCPRIEIKA
ncbi:uncharacterized protein LOC133784502 [Humulus lupulus]|uniref:uncharacterized protein LOC133784502 n=1 Tax=Humulus lupulus TaxID=3486 RepID=UPI002B416CD8|nr:uncharacterized protein LOC133784502 [Humulus lupulus]